MTSRHPVFTRYKRGSELREEVEDIGDSLIDSHEFTKEKSLGVPEGVGNGVRLEIVQSNVGIRVPLTCGVWASGDN